MFSTEELRKISNKLIDLCEQRARFVMSSRGSGDVKFLFPDGKLFYWNEWSFATEGFFISKYDEGGYGATENRVAASFFLKQILKHPTKGKQLSLFQTLQ